MPTRFYRIVNSNELAEFAKSRMIRRTPVAWPPYKANEVTFVLSDQATLGDQRCFVERLRDDGKHAYLLEIEILGPPPWRIDNDASFESYTKASAIWSDIVESANVKIRHVASFQNA
jgi:hypothetical protein